MHPSDRPLSPHLSIYRPQISSVLSITHRLTGIALYAGTLLLVSWLWAAAYSAPCFKQIHAFMSSVPGIVLLVGWTIAFFFHFINGLRHLWWDTGRGFAVKEINQSGWAVVLFTAVMTAATWWLVYNPKFLP